MQTIKDPQSLSNGAELPTYAGLLYFPKNPRNCTDSSFPSNGIPEDGVSLDRLPIGFNLIAMIPISVCTADYLIQAKHDQAEVAVLYNYTSPTSVPSISLTNSISVFSSPIFGITSEEAAPILQNMVNYSGNMSSVPFGRNLTSIYDPLDFVRLTLTVDTGQSSSIPGLWLFLLVILAALGVIVASTSISMHISQYRARRDLRRRIAAGEIDLESLGIKRLTVPQEVIDTMPIKIYGASSIPRSNPVSFVTPSPDAESQNSIASVPSNAQKHMSSDTMADTMAEVVSNVEPTLTDGFEQQSCAICWKIMSLIQLPFAICLVITSTTLIVLTRSFQHEARYVLCANALFCPKVLYLQLCS